MRITYFGAAALLLTIFWRPALRADQLTLPFTGNFTFDNDVVKFQVTLPVPEMLAVFTTSAATGGFAPYLVMWDATGTQLDQFNGGEPTCSDGFSTPRPGVGCNDTFVQEPPSGTIPAGIYYIGLAQTNNFATGGLNDPFTEDGVDNENYTNQLPYGGCPAGTYFCDQVALTGDTSNWTVNFEATNPAGAAQLSVTDLNAAPEPASSLVVLAALGLVAAIWRVRREAGPLASLHEYVVTSLR